MDFKTLVGEVAMGQIGAIFSLEASRLARSKQACIYIRQSTLAQVRFNQESTDRQYDLVNKALGNPCDTGLGLWHRRKSRQSDSQVSPLPAHDPAPAAVVSDIASRAVRADMKPGAAESSPGNRRAFDALLCVRGSASCYRGPRAR